MGALCFLRLSFRCQERHPLRRGGRHPGLKTRLPPPPALLCEYISAEKAQCSHRCSQYAVLCGGEGRHPGLKTRLPRTSMYSRPSGRSLHVGGRGGDQIKHREDTAKRRHGQRECTHAG